MPRAKSYTLKIVFLLLFAAGKLFAQPDETQNWIGAFVKYDNTNFISRTDVQLRFANDFSEWRTVLARAGIGRQLGDIKLFTGPAFFLSSVNGKFNFTKEFRLWEEAGYDRQDEQFAYSVRLRAEQRWIENVSGRLNYFNRIRVKTEAIVKFRKDESSKSGVVVSNELLYQHDVAGGWYPDHDRVSAGIQFFVSNNTGFQLLYVYFPFVKVGDQYDQRQVLRLNLLTEI